MEVKIDTKEKFTVFTPITATLDDNMAENLNQKAILLDNPTHKNVIINLKEVTEITHNVPSIWSKLLEEMMLNNASLVFCELQPQVKKALEAEDLLDILNITPTESEAWDIVQMEEMEREMFGEDFTD